LVKSTLINQAGTKLAAFLKQLITQL